MIIEEAQRELRKYPDYVDNWATLATAYEALGESVKAKDALQRFHQLNKHIPYSMT